jgi:hypothetical protein
LIIANKINGFRTFLFLKQVAAKPATSVIFYWYFEMFFSIPDKFQSKLTGEQPFTFRQRFSKL